MSHNLRVIAAIAAAIAELERSGVDWYRWARGRGLDPASVAAFRHRGAWPLAGEAERIAACTIRDARDGHARKGDSIR